jgi:TolB-like protein
MGGADASFGPFVLDRGRSALLRDGKAVALGQRGIALLDALLAADGPVAKQALMEAGWPGTIVEEGNLTVQIAALRKALGERADGGEWIVTVPRVGYRLVRGEAGAVKAEDPVALPLLAVLPFQNLGGDAAQDYFANGIVEDIITALSRFRSFAVVARNSSFVYKGRAIDVRQVGTELGVQYALEGSVRRAGDRLRVTAQLVETHSGAHLWAQKYDGAVEDLFDMQDRITEGVVGVVEPEIREAEIVRSRRDRPGSLTAYDLFLRGLDLKNRESPEALRAAAELFARAIEIEPNNGVYLINAAWTAQIGLVMGWPESSGEDRVRIARQCHAAIAASPKDGAVLADCGLLLTHTREYALAGQMVARAIETNPNSAIVMVDAGIYELHCGEIDSAIRYLHRVIALSPNDPEAYRPMTAIAHAHMVLGKFDDALHWAERALTLNRNSSATYWMLIAGNAKLGRMEQAQQYLELFRKVSPGTTIETIRDGQPDKYADRMANIFEGLAMAGLAER